MPAFIGVLRWVYFEVDCRRGWGGDVLGAMQWGSEFRLILGGGIFLYYWVIMNYI